MITIAPPSRQKVGFVRLFSYKLDVRDLNESVKKGALTWRVFSGRPPLRKTHKIIKKVLRLEEQEQIHPNLRQKTARFGISSRPCDADIIKGNALAYHHGYAVYCLRFDDLQRLLPARKGAN